MAKLVFALFVSSVEGHAVARFGTGAPTRSNAFIGATRSIEDPTQIEWRTDEVVPITEAEYRDFRREYDGAIAAGSLVKRTENDYAAWLEENGQSWPDTDPPKPKE